MSYHTAGSKTDDVRTLKKFSVLRRLMAHFGRPPAIPQWRQLRNWIGVMGTAAVLATTPVETFAQPPRSSGLSSPDSLSGTSTSRRNTGTSDSVSGTSSLSGKRKLPDIRQIRNLEEEDSVPEPKSPFQLDEPLASVEIEGNSTIVNSEIAKHIKVRPGRPVTQKQIKDDVDALVRTRWFASVEPAIRPSPDGNVLVFRVLERPIVRRVEYQGLKKVKQKVFDNLTQFEARQPIRRRFESRVRTPHRRVLSRQGIRFRHGRT